MDGVKSIKQVLGGGKINFYPDLEKVDKSQLLNCNFIIQDAKLISDWDGDFGLTSFFIVKVKPVEKDWNKEVTCVMSGVAIIKQLRKLVDSHVLPVGASLGVVKSERGNEYFILDDPRPEEN